MVSVGRCGEGEWQCGIGDECISISEVCGGVVDCRDGSDEANGCADSVVDSMVDADELGQIGR